MLISAVLDLIGVSAILPIISLLTNNDDYIVIDNVNAFVRIISKITGITRTDTLALFMLCLLALFYIFKTAYAFLNTYVMNKFAMSLSRRLTKRQIETYLAMPYEYHLNNNSSTLIRKCTYDINMFSASITTLLNFVIKGLTTVAIVIYLFITNWMVTLIIGGLLGLFSIFVILILKPHIKAVARKQQQLNSNNYKYLSQAFNGIKESKISGTEQYFVDMYDSNIKEIHRFTLRNTMYHSIPGHSIELIGMTGLIVSLTIVIGTKSQMDVTNTNIIEMFSVFAYAVIKMLPYITEINATFNNMTTYKVSIDSVYKDIIDSEQMQKDRNSLNTNGIEEMSFNNEIKIKNLTFAYSTVPDKKILDNVSCTIKKNTSVAFSGASGAGKTTMIDNILGLLEGQEGSIEVDGVDIKTNMKGWRKNISYIPQTIYLMDDTIRNNIAFGKRRQEIDDDKIWDALEKAQLHKFVRELPNGLDTVIGERGVRLSGGQRQRLGIARAFYRDTNVVVFDEATSALDYDTEKKILDHVNKYASDHTLIIITHRLNTIDTCDSIYKVEDGKLIVVK